MDQFHKYQACAEQLHHTYIYISTFLTDMSEKYHTNTRVEFSLPPALNISHVNNNTFLPMNPPLPRSSLSLVQTCRLFLVYFCRFFQWLWLLVLLALDRLSHCIPVKLWPSVQPPHCHRIPTYKYVCIKNAALTSALYYEKDSLEFKFRYFAKFFLKFSKLSYDTLYEWFSIIKN